MDFGFMLDQCPGKMTVFWKLEVDKYLTMNTIWYVNSLGAINSRTRLTYENVLFRKYWNSIDRERVTKLGFLIGCHWMAPFLRPAMIVDLDASDWKPFKVGDSRLCWQRILERSRSPRVDRDSNSCRSRRSRWWFSYTYYHLRRTGNHGPISTNSSKNKQYLSW